MLNRLAVEFIEAGALTFIRHFASLIIVLFTRKIHAMKQVVITFLSLTFLISCIRKEDRSNKSAASFVNPRIPAADLPVTEYDVTAETGDTLFYPSGSILVFPKNAFTDAEGRLIRGNVTVKYREFAGPTDFFLAGIPMEYDSAGVSYTFESAGMCEVLASQEGKPVFVNPAAKPEMYLASRSDFGADIYFLDTIRRNWVNKGSRERYDCNQLLSFSEEMNQPELSSRPAPVKPREADGKSPVIKILIDSSFPELSGYNNLLFELDAAEKNFDPGDAKRVWSDVKLEKDARKGNYRVRFIRPDREVVYVCSPVFEGDDYKKAMKVFERKQKEFEKQWQASQARRKEALKKYVADSLTAAARRIENEKLDRLNALIEARNREAGRLDSINNARIQNEAISRSCSNLLTRFTIDGFGVWNIDRPLTPDDIPVAVIFKDSTGKEINLSRISMVYKGLNSILSFPDNNLRLSKTSENMIMGVCEGKFALVPYARMKAAGMPVRDGKIEVVADLFAEHETNYEFIKSLSGR